VNQARKAKTQDQPADLKGRLIAMYRAQPAKIILFAVLAAVLGAVLVINVFFRGKGRRASAANRPIIMAAQPSGGGPAKRSADAKTWRYRDVAARWTEEFVLIERLNRDPFQVDMTWFPLNPDHRQSSTVEALLSDGAAADPLTRHIRQWASEINRRRRARESEQAAVKAAAGSLKLSTVMVSGANSLAVINGQALRIGEKVNGFTVVRIEPGRVVVNRNGVPIILALED